MILGLPINLDVICPAPVLYSQRNFVAFLPGQRLGADFNGYEQKGQQMTMRKGRAPWRFAWTGFDPNRAAPLAAGYTITRTNYREHTLVIVTV